MAYPPKYDRSLILSLIREGKTDEEVRRVVGCSTSLVQQYRKSAKLPPNGRNRPWSEGEDTTLRRLYEAGDRREDIARFLNRTLSEVMHRSARIGISHVFNKYHDRTRVYDLVWLMLERGYSRESISRRMKLATTTVNKIARLAPNCFDLSFRKKRGAKVG